MYLVIVTHARQRESTLFKYLHTFFSGIAVMWDTCKGWWEGKNKVEVDEELVGIDINIGGTWCHHVIDVLKQRDLVSHEGRNLPIRITS